MKIFVTRAAEDMQGGGTFDSSGAFRDERWSDEEDADGKKKRVLKRRDGPPGAQNGVDAHEPAAQEQPVEAKREETPGTPESPARTVTPPSAVAESTSPARSPGSSGAGPVRADEDGLEHAQAVVSTLVAQLVEDEEQPKPAPSPPSGSVDQWFYRFVVLWRELSANVTNFKSLG